MKNLYIRVENVEDVNPIWEWITSREEIYMSNVTPKDIVDRLEMDIEVYITVVNGWITIRDSIPTGCDEVVLTYMYTRKVIDYNVRHATVEYNGKLYHASKFEDAIKECEVKVT